MLQILRKERLQNALNSDQLEGRQANAIQAEIRDIEAMLEGAEKGKTGDPLADYWEAQIDAGEMPDLTMSMADLERMKRND